MLSDGGCDDASSLLSSLSAAIARSSTGSLPTMTVYPQSLCTPTYEDIPFEEPNLDSIAIRAPYVSRHGTCDDIGTNFDGKEFGVDDLSALDLSNEDFNSMFEQVISQSRPSAGRAVLATVEGEGRSLGCSPIDPYMQQYMNSPMVSGACPPASYRSKISPPLKRSALGLMYEDRDLKPLSMNASVYGSNIYWQGDTAWSQNEQRMLYQQYGSSVSRPA
ncbi:hypothetical protein COOONC_13781 [Cooperia oncophora]